MMLQKKKKKIKKRYTSSIYITYCNYADRKFACITAVQNRAERFYLGVGRYTPNAAVNGDIGWLSLLAKQWKSVVNQRYRINIMYDERLNKKVYKMGYRACFDNCKNWCFRVRKCFKKAKYKIHSLQLISL